MPAVMRHLTILALAAALAASPAASALTADPAPIEVLWVEADAVVHGTVISTVAERVPGAARVATRVTITLWQHPKPPVGRPLAATLSFTLPGGDDGRLTTVVPGVPSLLPGDEVVLLLERRNDAWVPIGYRLGTLFLSRDGTLVEADIRGRPGGTVRGGGWLSDALGVRR